MNPPSPSQDDQLISPPEDVGTLRELLRIAMPLVISSGTMSIMHAIDRMFLAWHSSDAFASAMPAGILAWTFGAVAFGIAMYTNTFVAQYHGNRQYSRMCDSVWQGVYLATLFGSLMMLLWPLAPSIFEWAAHDPDLQAMESDYFGVLCAGGIPMLVSAVFSCFFTGQGKTIVVMVVNIAAMLVNVLLDYALIFGNWNFPMLGIKGAALATISANLFACVVYLAVISSHSKKHKLPFWESFHLDWGLIWRMIRYGTPQGVQYLIDVGAFAIFSIFIGQLGKVEMAATTLAFTLNSLAFVPMSGIGTAVMILVGQRVGEGRPELAIRTTYLAFAFAATYMGLWCLGYLFIPDILMEPFLETDNLEESKQIANLTITILYFVVIYGFFDAMAIIFGNAIRGAGDTRYAMILMLICGLSIFVLPTLLVWYFLQGNLWYYWGAATIYIVVIGVLFLLRFLGGRWTLMSVIEVNAQDNDAIPPESSHLGEPTGILPATLLTPSPFEKGVVDELDDASIDEASADGEFK